MLKRLKAFFTLNNTLLLVALVSFFLLLRWNHFTAPFERDEGVYAYSAWIFRQGINPYEYSFPYKPPMIIYTYLSGQTVFGDVVWGPRVLLAAASLIVIFLTGMIAKKEFGLKTAWITIWLLSLMLILPVNFGRGILADVYYAANTEIFMLLPLMSLLALFVFYKDNSRPWLWGLGGVFAAIAVGYKPICVPILIFIYLVWMVKSWKAKDGIKQIILKVLAAFLGVILTSFLIYLPFILNDGGKAVMDQMLGFTACYKSMGNWDYGPGQFFSRLIIMGRYYWVLYLLLSYLIFKHPRNWKYLLALLAVSFLSVYQSVIGHYYLQVMPFLAMVSAYGLTLLLKEKSMQKVHSWLAVFVVIIILLVPVRYTVGKTPEELALWVYGPYDPFMEAQLVGKKVQELTSPQDYVFIEGMDPEILYFSQRRHAVKMEWTNFLSSDCKQLEKYNSEYLSDWKANNPSVIVLCIKGSCGTTWSDPKLQTFNQELWETLNKDYQAVGGWIPGGKGYWLEPIGKEDIPEARTVLFKRRI